jgi:AcrR family transcriptional regulator
MPTAKRRRLAPAERRGLILDAAMGVFAARGYQEASVGEIAAAAGIAPSVIYDHFASKADLQITLLESQTDQLLADVATAIGGAPENLTARMRAGVEAFFGFVEDHAYAWRMLFRDPPSDPALADSHRRMDRRATVAIALFLKAYAPGATLEDPGLDRSAEMFAQMLKTAQNGLAVWWYEHRDVGRAELVDRVMDFCWTGLASYAGTDA